MTEDEMREIYTDGERDFLAGKPIPSDIAQWEPDERIIYQRGYFRIIDGGDSGPE